MKKLLLSIVLLSMAFGSNAQSFTSLCLQRAIRSSLCSFISPTALTPIMPF